MEEKMVKDKFEVTNYKNEWLLHDIHAFLNRYIKIRVINCKTKYWWILRREINDGFFPTNLKFTEYHIFQSQRKKLKSTVT